MNTEDLIKAAEAATKVWHPTTGDQQFASSGIRGVEVIINHKKGKRRVMFTQGGDRISRNKAETILTNS